jgi:Fe-S oxidoreductase
MDFDSPARATYWLIQGRILFIALYVLGTACFAWIVAKRLTPLRRARKDFRLDRPWMRIERILQYWLGQWRHPRYWGAGIIHVLIFAGFLILAMRAFALLIFGVSNNLVMPGGRAYGIVRDYAATVVFALMIVAAIRRTIFKPQRYRVPARFGKDRTAGAVFLLALIAVLMAADGLFDAARAAAHAESLPHGSLSWAFQKGLFFASLQTLWALYLGAYLLHGLTFFFLLCYRPFGVQFHVETSLFSIYFAKLERGTLKPVRWDVSEADLDQVKSLGVKTFEDFTWKHILDFYSCADCGRCSDQCPSNTAGRALSPRFFTLKARDYCYQHYPVLGRSGNGTRLVGSLYSEDEIWSCTTCGSCEAECPLLIEYIDKIVDLRRGLIDEGKVPQSLQKPLKALESRGNPYGKLEKKRADWAACGIRILNGNGNRADTLYFVDSITSYDERMQAIGRATARILGHAGLDFGILGACERDSGHDVRRFGEEMLFLSLREHNAEAIRASGVRRIVTADPHAFNALQHDYRDLPPVEHISQVIAREVEAGAVRFEPVANPDDVYTYHDPCYLGRHNQVFDEPRKVLDAIPGLKRVEMRRCRDRSFCCGGGGLALFYEPKEEERIGVKRVRMAAEAGASVIVTACPFCLTNIEDAIKVAGMEGTIAAIDLAELVEKQLEPRLHESVLISRGGRQI